MHAADSASRPVRRDMLQVCTHVHEENAHEEKKIPAVLGPIKSLLSCQAFSALFSPQSTSLGEGRSLLYTASWAAGTFRSRRCLVYIHVFLPLPAHICTASQVVFHSLTAPDPLISPP